MPLWKANDSAGNSTIHILSQLNKSANTNNQNTAFSNVTANVFFSGRTDGVFGVDTSEQAASRMQSSNGRPQHAGWVLRTVGTGGRAGRVQCETLVAMGSMAGDSENVAFPQFGISITSQPQSFSGSNTANVNLTVSAIASPNTQLYYQWQRDGGPGSKQFANVANTGVFQSANGNTTTTLSISNTSIGAGQTLNGNVFRVLVSTVGGPILASQNVTITVV